MGKAIERLAIEQGHAISAIVQADNDLAWENINAQNTEVAIEFSQPESAVANILKLAEKRIPIVCGTTGWWNQLPEITRIIQHNNTTLIYGGNFSIGMNLLFRLNQKLAEWMEQFPEYDPWIIEKHHRQKKDAPGGSAKMLADQILTNLSRKSELSSAEDLKHRSPNPEELSLSYIRAGFIIGEHEVGYSSAVDCLSIRHQAINRDGFAAGALRAAGFAKDKNGVWEFSTLMAAQMR